MSGLQVLKFGGSFLRGPEDLLSAVDVIYAHVRRGERVVAVTSAFHGRTDELESTLARLDAERGVPSSEKVRAALLATGEVETANLLCAALDRAGVPAVCADVRRFGPFVEPGTEEPERVDAEALRALFDEVAVICLPGFAAVEDTPERDPALLGRGGSDLTAVLVGRDLGAEVTLVKDVEGLYSADPAGRRDADQPVPRRLARVSFDDALGLGPDILQPRAVHFARTHKLPFDVVGPGHVAGTRGTRVGFLPSVGRSRPETPRPLRVALLGLGAVGARVFAQLSAAPERFEVVSILVRDLGRTGRPRASAGLLTDDFDAVLAAAPDLIVEATGGHQPAAARMARALKAGVHVVTANKVAASEARPSLDEVARAAGTRFACSAAVGGALPALEAVARAALRGEQDRLIGFEGVLNGTSNAVLDAVADGIPRDEAVAHARSAGLAEADPTADLDGTDVAHKLVLLTRAAGWDEPRWLRRDGIDDAAAAPEESGQRLRLVGGVFLSDVGPVAQIGPRWVGPASPFHGVRGPWNALVLHYESGRTEVLRGRGAGPWPTAAALLGDVLALSRRLAIGRVNLAAEGAAEGAIDGAEDE